jgi:predicted nucleic acid-binding protein
LKPLVAAALAFRAPSIGANDRVHVATCALNGIDTIVSADRDLDRVRGLRRIDPLNAAALDRLVSAG